ncbi:hypothetical protein V8D89_009580 [Ganoderma adspersum]
MSGISTTLNEVVWDYTVHGVEVAITFSALPAALQLLLSVLFFPSFIMLFSRWRKIGPSSFGLAFNILALYISTWVYFVTNILSVKAYLLQSILESPGALYGIGNSNAERNRIEDSLMHYYSIAQCAGTATLTLNILFANTIICWRSALLWRRSIIVVWLIFGFMLSATFAAGAADTRWACWPWATSGPGTDTAGTGNMYGGYPAGVAAAALTFATNVLAMTLYVVKILQSKEALGKYMAQGSKFRNVLTLVFESGAPYCALWTVVLAWAAGMNTQAIAWYYYEDSFWDIVDVLVNAALVPLAAIQATYVIWLLVRGKSPVEHCVAESAPPPPLQPAFFAYQTQPETLIHTQYMAQHQQQPGPYIVQHQQY